MVLGPIEAFKVTCAALQLVSSGLSTLVPGIAQPIRPFDAVCGGGWSDPFGTADVGER